MSNKKVSDVLNDGHYLEVMDRLYLCTSIVDNHVMQHPVCKVYEELRLEVEKALEHLCVAYQIAGHLSVENNLKK